MGWFTLPPNHKVPILKAPFGGWPRATSEKVDFFFGSNRFQSTDTGPIGPVHGP